MVGIAGGSGSGKSTIAATVAAALPGVLLIQHDLYYRHRPELDFRARTQINYDHPDSLETDLLIAHLEELDKGLSVALPTYDFTSHLRALATTPVEPAPVVIVEGILVLADPELRSRLDLKIYIDTDLDLRLARRIQRDISERGRSVDSVLEQYSATVRPMHFEFVESSKRYADLITSEGYTPRAVATVVDMIRSYLAVRNSSFPLEGGKAGEAGRGEAL